MFFGKRPPQLDDGPIVMVDDSDADAMIARVYHGKSRLTQPFVHLPGGEELVEYLADPTNAMPSLVMLDINMIGMSGFDALEVIRTQPRTREVPVVIMVTSSKADADMRRAETSGANGYFVKPLGGTEYASFFNELLDDQS
jgi:CheY-like chemotaxis protein